MRLGRSLSPIKKPDIGSVRDPRLHAPSIHPLLARKDLYMTSFSRAYEIDLAVDGHPGYGFEDVSLGAPESAEFKAILDMEGEIVEVLERFRPVPPYGALFYPTRHNGQLCPPPLPRTYRLGWESGSPAAKEIPGSIEMMRPFLEPSVLAPETSPLVLPAALRPDQIEALNALHANDGFLLGDDVGMGKTIVACVAMTALFQQGEINRVLYVCTEGRRRAIAGMMASWAPGLMVTCVRGDRNIRALDWSVPAHVVLVDYQTLTTDLDVGMLEGDALRFDLLVLDGLHTSGLRFQDFPGSLLRLRAERRWALAGALPVESEDWLALFGFLTPDELGDVSDITLADVRKRFRPYLMRRTKENLAEALPRKSRQELWLDLSPSHARAYEEALAEERHRLSRLGSSVTSAHINSAIDNLKGICNFPPRSLDSVKARTLVDLVEQIAASDAKVIIFSHSRDYGLDRIQPVLEPYGVLRLDSQMDEERRNKILRAFREQSHWHVLLLEMGTRTDGEGLVEASYVIHFDQSWNPAHRLRAEARLYPDIFAATPINIYEFWVTDTIDEKIHNLLAVRRLTAAEVPQGTQPGEIEDRIKILEWLTEILEVETKGEPESVAVRHPSGTGILPGTSILRSRLSELSPDTLMAAVETLIKALGYPETEQLDEADDEGGYILAWRVDGPEVERVLVRCIRTESNVGVAKARALLKAMETRRDCMGAYLVATADFTASCKKFADDTDGQLALVSGSELYRHLHILGRV